MIYAGRLLNKDINISGRFEEKHNVDDFSESSESKTEVKAIFRLVSHVPW
jgi:hypothetical protein